MESCKVLAGEQRSTSLWFVGCLTSQQHASVSWGRICSDSCTCCHTETEVADQTFILPSHSILTSGQPVPALTLYHQAPGRVATGVPILKSLVRLDLGSRRGRWRTVPLTTEMTSPSTETKFYCEVQKVKGDQRKLVRLSLCCSRSHTLLATRRAHRDRLRVLLYHHMVTALLHTQRQAEAVPPHGHSPATHTETG